jgi:hypothetical protein
MTNAMPRDSRPSVALTRFVGRVLQHIDPDAVLRDFHSLNDTTLVIQLGVRGKVGKDLALPRRLVEKSPRNRWAETMLRRILRSELRLLRSGGGMSEAPASLAGIEPDPMCPVCLTPVPPEEPLFLLERRVVHVRCFIRRARPPRGVG